MKQRIALIDGDIICYRVGFACKEGEPVSFALHSVKEVVGGILNRCGTDDYRLFLTGKYNFREQLCSIKPYKGTRSERKPEHFTAIRDYLLDRWNGELIEGMEADDALGIAQWAAPDKSTIICTIDKDLDMIPGWHFNWVKDNKYDVSLDDGDLWFYKQMLLGDVSDNIPGITGLGPKKTDKLLAPLGYDFHKIHQTVAELYKKQYGSDGERAFDEIASLLWILREVGKPWSAHVPR